MAYRRKSKTMESNWTPQRIKELRAAYGESQYVFCHRLGVTPGALQYWEQGKGEPSRPVQIILEWLEERKPTMQTS